eukprot:5122300-Prymnesium_polylepis.1
MRFACSPSAAQGARRRGCWRCCARLRGRGGRSSPAGSRDGRDCSLVVILHHAPPSALSSVPRQDGRCGVTRHLIHGGLHGHLVLTLALLEAVSF